MDQAAPLPPVGRPLISMERYAEPLFGLLTTLLMWWFLSDFLDNFSDSFLAVILFAAAVVMTVVWIYDLYETFTDRSSDSERH